MTEQMQDVPLTWKCVELKSWDDAWHLSRSLVETNRPNTAWLFRGLKDARYPLSSTLDRAGEHLGRGRTDLEDIERRVLARFRETAHLYGSELRPEDSNIEWLAMAQHYGGPTRLIDFSRSFWVGVFFAIQVKVKASPLTCQQTVWAIEGKEVCKRALRLLQEQVPDLVGDVADWWHYRELMKVSRAICSRRVWVGGDGQKPCPLCVTVALPVIPQRMNARLAAQRGAFMFAPALEATFEESLRNTLGPDCTQEQLEPQPYCRSMDFGDRLGALKILLPNCAKDKGIRILQDMNIHAASLFPDMQGAAMSLFSHFAW